MTTDFNRTAKKALFANSVKHGNFASKPVSAMLVHGRILPDVRGGRVQAVQLGAIVRRCVAGGSKKSESEKIGTAEPMHLSENSTQPGTLN
jgi:hypothetical protein